MPLAGSRPPFRTCAVAQEQCGNAGRPTMRAARGSIAAPGSSRQRSGPAAAPAAANARLLRTKSPRHAPNKSVARCERVVMRHTRCWTREAACWKPRRGSPQLAATSSEKQPGTITAPPHPPPPRKSRACPSPAPRATLRSNRHSAAPPASPPELQAPALSARQ